MDERRRPRPDPPGGLAAVGDEVVAEFAVGAFDGRVHLVARRLEPRLGMTSSKCWISPSMLL